MNLNLFEHFMSLLGLCPLRRKLFTWIYGMTLLTLIVLSFCFQIYGRIHTKFGRAMYIGVRGITIGTLNTAIDLFCTVIITLPTLHSNEKFNTEIKDEINDIDAILLKYIPDMYHWKQKSSLVYLVILNIFYLGLVLNDALLLMGTEGKTNYQFYIFDHFYRYRTTMCALYIYDLIKACLQRMITTNNILKMTFQKVCTRSLMEEPDILNNLEELVAEASSLHSKFSLIVGSINAIFGWSMLFIFFNYMFLFVTAYEMGLCAVMYNSERMYWQYFFWAVFSMAYSLVSEYEI